MDAVVASVRWLGFALAAVCLAGAGLAGLIAATADQAPCVGQRCTALNSEVAQLASTVAVVAAVALVVGAASVLGARRAHTIVRWIVWVAAVAAAVAMVLLLRGSQVAPLRDVLYERIPVLPQAWVVEPAITVSVVGLLALVVGVFPPPLRPRVWSGGAAIAVGTAAAVAVCATQLGPALSKPTDNDLVAHTTAPSAEMPPFPARLGQQRFTLPLPVDDPHRPAMRLGAVVAGGTGFVTLRGLPETGDAPAVVAYDATGQQRWYYSRTGPLPLRNFDVFDDGAVVIAAASDSESVLLVGLDAVTGELLWTSNDPLLSASFKADHGYPWRAYTPFLVDRGEDHWTSYDPRTGRQTWQIPNPLRCPDGRRPIRDAPLSDPLARQIGDTEFDHVDSSERLIVVVDCSTTQRLDLQEIVVAPATGEIISQRLVPVPDRLRGQVPGSWYVEPMGANGYTIDLFWRGEPLSELEVFVDTTSERTVVLDDGLADREGYIYVGPTGPDGGFVVVDRDNNVRTFSGTGEERCGFRPTPVGQKRNFGDITVLGEEIVYLQGASIRVVSRADCTQIATLPLPAEGEMSIAPVRGATLFRTVPSADDTDITVFGYS